MKQFNDSNGKQWDIVVNTFTAKAVRDLTTVDLFNIYSTEAAKVFSDPILFVNVLYVLCKKQCDERKMTDEDFGRSLTGDSLDTASTALLEEVAGFFPESRKQAFLKLLTKANLKAAEVESKLLAAIEAI